MRTIKRTRDVRWLLGRIRVSRDVGTLLMLGPPSAGKVVLARRLAESLPEPDEQTRLEQAWIWTASGLGLPRSPLPFRAPHHTCSRAALVGGGPPQRQRPGEVSLAHGGTLLLDEVTEFPRAQVEDVIASVLRRRAYLRADWAEGGWVKIPSHPRLVIATAYDCPGGCGDHRTNRVCSCSEPVKRLYAARLGHVAERFDLTVRVQLPTPYSEGWTGAMRRLLAPPSAQSGVYV